MYYINELVIDSWGRFPSGLISGTVTAFGDYDQCIDIDHTVNGKTIVGKYCLLDIRLPIPSSPITFNENISTNSLFKTIVKNPLNYMRITNGICIPSVCTKLEMTLILQKGMYIFII